MRNLLTSLLIIFTVGCTAIPEPTVCQDNNDEEYFSSTITGGSYPINVYLPPEYDSTDISYPVIYVTDGDWYYYDFVDHICQSNISAIIVAIGTSGRRNIDYLPPGSSNYYQFLSAELLPYIESKYRISVENRSVFGHSYGGRLITEILFMEIPSSSLFHNYIAADPSLWSNTEELIGLANRRYAITDKITGRLIITEASGGNAGIINAFEDVYKEIGFSELDITKHYYDSSHKRAAFLSFRDAVDLIFVNE